MATYQCHQTKLGGDTNHLMVRKDGSSGLVCRELIWFAGSCHKFDTTAAPIRSGRRATRPGRTGRMAVIARSSDMAPPGRPWSPPRAADHGQCLAAGVRTGMSAARGAADRAPDALGGGGHRQAGDAERGEGRRGSRSLPSVLASGAASPTPLAPSGFCSAGDGAYILRRQRSQVSRRRQDIGGAETAENWTS